MAIPETIFYPTSIQRVTHSTDDTTYERDYYKVTGTMLDGYQASFHFYDPCQDTSILTSWETVCTNEKIEKMIEARWASVTDLTKINIMRWEINSSSTGDSWYRHYEPPRPRSPSDRLREIMRSRSSPAIHVRRPPIMPTANLAEIRARQVVRRCLGEEKYKEFLRTGGVSLRGSDGLMYRIYPGHRTTEVYRDGQLIERLCVVLRGDFPPADSLIMRYLLILNDLEFFRSKAVVTRYQSAEVRRFSKPSPSNKPLTEIFRELKGAAA